MSHSGKIWRVSGLLLLAAALCLTVYNMAQANQAGEAAADVVAQLAAMAPGETTPAPAPQSITSLPLSDLPDYVRNPEKEMPTQTVNGYEYIGVLTIPVLNLELPVMSTWDYTRLRIAPCRYTGSAYQDNLTICAHNYASHFGTLKTLQTGDSVTFTDVEGNVFSYAVAQVETLEPTALEEMTQSNYPLTLFTCTPGGATRVTIRCEQAAF